MKKFCENQYCENTAVKEVPVSVKKPADQTRALCNSCEETYTWGVQHGRMTAKQRQLWILAVADRGIITRVRAYSSQALAETAMIKYLRKQYKYAGAKDAASAYAWLRDHEYVGADIVEQHELTE